LLKWDHVPQEKKKGRGETKIKLVHKHTYKYIHVVFSMCAVVACHNNAALISVYWIEF
jgi:hypothetical protein